MKIDKKNLVKVLQKAKPGLAKKAIIEQFTHFIFTGTHVMTYNDEICICCPFPTDFQCSVKAEDLWKIVNGIKEEGLDIKLEESQLVIRSGKTQAGLSTVVDKDAEEMIALLKLGEVEDKWSEFPDEGKDFLYGASLCMFSASKDMTKGIATCIHVNDTRIESSDAIRISMYELKEPLKIETLIPARNILELTSFNITHYYLTDSWIHFKTPEGVTFSSRIMEGNYPDIDPYFDIDFENRVRLPQELKKVVDSIAFMTEGEVDLERSIMVEIEKDHILCKAEKRIGWIKKKIDFTYKQQPFKVMMNPNFLSQVMEKATSMKSTENVALFMSGNFKHIISLHSDEVEQTPQSYDYEPGEGEEDDIPF